jgi:hypothetical protein
MGYAGYGNHAEPPGTLGRPDALPRDQTTPATTRQKQGDTDPPSQSRIEQARFARIEPGLTPPWHEISPHRRDGNPSVPPTATREVSTPAEGAGPLPTEGDDVDPGLG